MKKEGNEISISQNQVMLLADYKQPKRSGIYVVESIIPLNLRPFGYEAETPITLKDDVLMGRGAQRLTPVVINGVKELIK